MNTIENGLPAVSRCRQNWAIGIGVLEMITSVIGMSIYTYSYITFLAWREVIPLPIEFISDRLIQGLISSSALICVLQFLMAILLFDGARGKRMHNIRTWLICMCTYMVLTIATVAGLYSSGLKSPEWDAFICFAHFIRVLIILPVYAFLEDENLKKMKKCAATANNNDNRQCSTSGNNNNSRMSITEPENDPNANNITIIVTCENETESDTAAIIPAMY